MQISDSEFNPGLSSRESCGLYTVSECLLCGVFLKKYSKDSFPEGEIQ